jgi:Cu(I)/Ag(I) efflux system membrane fusion protein
MSDKRWQDQLLRWGIAACALLLAFSAGRFLAPEPAPETADHADHADHADKMWTCSMHPNVRQPEPGACPICGMDLILANPSSDGGSTDRVVLSERAQVLAELRTTEVRRQSDASSELRLLGRIEPAETSRRNVTTWIGGRIDRLHVNTTGERVRRGQVIATLYSPEVYAAHQDLLTAQGQVERLIGASESTRQAADAALGASRQRLRLLGVPDAEIDAMARADAPTRTVSIRSPFSGTVIERSATEGAYVGTGASLYSVADLGTLWVQLDAYESDLARLQVGQTVALSVDALPGEVFEGRVDFIDPTLDATRRTAGVRVVVENTGGRLRPGLFAEAVVQVAAADGASPLVIPDSAPLFTGRRSVVYVQVQTDQGPAYEPRTVRLGPRLGDVYPVVSGLSEGERVVSRGAFALDADLQIRGGASMMTRADDRTPDGVEPVVLAPAERAALRPVLERYLEVQVALAADDLDAAVAAAAALGLAVDDVDVPPSAQAAWTAVAAELSGHAAHVGHADSLEAARGGFEPLSAAVETLLARFGNPTDQPLHVAFCPMARGNEGARWVQAGATIDNAYFGDAMRTCGDVTEAVAPGDFLDAAP